VVEHRCRPCEPGDELEPQTRIGRDVGVVESKHKGGDGTTVHLFVGPVARVHTHDGGVVADRLRVRGWPAQLLGPVSGKPLGVLGVDASLEWMSQDRVGQATSVPRLGESQQSVGPAHRLVDRELHVASVAMSSFPPAARRAPDQALEVRSEAGRRIHT
jgi:hypothetical protein